MFTEHQIAPLVTDTFSTLQLPMDKFFLSFCNTPFSIHQVKHLSLKKQSLTLVQFDQYHCHLMLTNNLGVELRSLKVLNTGNIAILWWFPIFFGKGIRWPIVEIKSCQRSWVTRPHPASWSATTVSPRRIGWRLGGTWRWLAVRQPSRPRRCPSTSSGTEVLRKNPWLRW